MELAVLVEIQQIDQNFQTGIRQRTALVRHKVVQVIDGYPASLMDIDGVVGFGYREIEGRNQTVPLFRQGTFTLYDLMEQFREIPVVIIEHFAQVSVGLG